jgi:hypothetical protein
MLDSEENTQSAYSVKYIYALYLELAICVFILVMLAVNIATLHTPMMLSVQYPLVIAFYCDMYC